MKAKLRIFIRFLGRYKTKSIFVRDFAVMLLITLIPLSGIGSFFYISTKNVVEKEIIEINEANLKRCAGVIDTMIDEINWVVANITMQDEISLYMLSGNEINESLSIRDKANECLKRADVTRKYIDSIYLYHEKSDTVFSSGNIIARDDFDDIGWYEDYKNNNERFKTTVNLRLKKNKYPYLITIVRPITATDTLKKIGAVVCNLNIEVLCDLVEGDDVVVNNFLMTDDNNVIVYSRNKKLIGSLIDTDRFSILYDLRSGRAKLGEKSIVSVSTSSKDDSWKYAISMPISNYMDKINMMFGNVRVIIMFCIIFSFIIALFIAAKSFGFVARIISIIESYNTKNTVRSDNFNETDYILSNIVSTIEMNEEMQHKLIEQFNEMRRAQTVALQAQISPHFIRNTLEMINVKAFEISHGENEVSQMLSQFSSLLDSFINSSNYIVSFASEIKYIRMYNEIMTMRFDNRIKFFYSFPEELEQYRVIKLSLQPIVENAITHGLKSNRYRGNVWISGQVKEKYAEIVVDDDGMGMSVKDIEKLNRDLNSANSTEKIGIYNVNKRYKIVFGDEYGLSLKISDRGGLAVQIKIPKPNQ